MKRASGSLQKASTCFREKENGFWSGGSMWVRGWRTELLPRQMKDRPELIRFLIGQAMLFGQPINLTFGVLIVVWPDVPKWLRQKKGAAAWHVGAEGLRPAEAKRDLTAC
jgi:hypothetical protein